MRNAFKIMRRAGGAAAAALVALLVSFSAPGVSAAQVTADQAVVGGLKVPDSNPSIGAASAPVTMEIWSDYQCPYCMLLWQDALPRVVSKYVTSGQLRIVFKDFEFLGEDSVTTALFARAVWDLYPQRFYDWNKTVFGVQGNENGGWASLDRIIELTNDIRGLDSSLLSAHLDANKTRYAQAIEADMIEGRSAGVEGTPTILIKSKPLDGLYSFENISAAIDKELATGSETSKR